MVATVNTFWYANFGNGSSTGYYAVTAWSAGATIAAGALRRQLATPTTGNERVFICIVAGITGGAEPAWVITVGAKTTDNTVTWQEVTGRPALNGDITNTPLSSGQRNSGVSLGSIIKNNAATFLFVCTTAGTAGVGEPSYNTTTGATTVDSGVTWTCIGSSFSAWSAPFARIGNASISVAVADTIYVSSAHAETQTTAISWLIGGNAFAGAPTGVYCIANAGSIPPGAADLTTGASVSVTGNVNLTIDINLDIVGIAFNCGSGANVPTLRINTSTGYLRLKNCSLNLTATGGASMQFGSAGAGGRTELINTTLGFGGSTSQSVNLSGGELIWRDTPTALTLASGSWPSAPFGLSSTGRSGHVLFEGVDLSPFAGTTLFTGSTSASQRVVINRCKLPSQNIVGAQNASTTSPLIDVINCDTGGNTYRNERWTGETVQTTEATIVHTGGASDGTTTTSWKFVTGAAIAVSWTRPFEALPISIWNATTGGNVVVTLEGIISAATIPNNDDVWIDVTYFGTASSTRVTRATGTKASVLATNAALTSSSAAWDGAATARQNTHAYSLGDVMKVASNAGRLFFCTQLGTSAGSEPVGYASAVDGGSVTDGGAIFRAGVRFQLVATCSSVQAAGYLQTYIRLAKNSTTLYVDFKPTLS